MASKPAFRRILNALGQTRSYSAPADRSIPAAKQKYVPTSGTYPKGFLAGSAFAGVKASNTKYDDMALVVSEQPCPAACVVTKNIFKAAPVVVSKQITQDAKRQGKGIRGVVVNSGCANAVTGQLGREHALTMALETDKLFNEGIDEDGSDRTKLPQTMVMSTGVIGQRLPIDRITGAIPAVHRALGSTHDHWMNAAQAICTTDTFPKLISRTFTLPSHPDTTYSIAGMTKGAGMIHPNMATLLGIICTDAKIDNASMYPFLRDAVGKSFNSISIDGDTSTNDTVAFFANGAAAPANAEPLALPELRKNAPGEKKQFGLQWTERPSEDAIAFRAVLRDFCQDLSKLVVRDGEGATKFVTIRVQSAVHSVAKRVAVSIARSALVKTALYGKDANWGRILCAIGYTPGLMDSPEDRKNPFRDPTTRYPVQPHKTSVSFVPTDGGEELKLLTRGEPEQVDEERAKQILEMEDLEILVRLNDEDEPPQIFESVFWTCDLSHEYVTINGDYRT